MTTTLNPADLSGVTLSNGNLTATYASTTYGQSRSTTSKSTGKWHVEFTINAVTVNGFPKLGVASASHTFTNWCGQDLNSCGLNDSHFSYLNSSPVNLLTTAYNFHNSDVIAVEVDLTGNLIYFQNFTQGSGWSASRDISTMTNSPFFVDVNLMSASEQVTVNFGATAFSVALQSGFAAWDTGGGATPKLCRQGNMDGIGSGGPFFSNPLARSVLGWRPSIVTARRKLIVPRHAELRLAA